MPAGRCCPSASSLIRTATPPNRSRAPCPPGPSPAAGLACRRASRPAAAPAALPEAAASAAAALELSSSGLGDVLLSTHTQRLVAEVAEGLEAPVQLAYLVTLMGFLVVGAYLVVRQVGAGPLAPCAAGAAVSVCGCGR